MLLLAGAVTNKVTSTDVLCWGHRNRIAVLKERQCSEVVAQKQVSVGQQGTHLSVFFPFESLLI